MRSSPGWSWFEDFWDSQARQNHCNMTLFARRQRRVAFLLGGSRKCIEQSDKRRGAQLHGVVDIGEGEFREIFGIPFHETVIKNCWGRKDHRDWSKLKHLLRWCNGSTPRRPGSSTPGLSNLPYLIFTLFTLFSLTWCSDLRSHGKKGAWPLIGCRSILACLSFVKRSSVRSLIVDWLPIRAQYAKLRNRSLLPRGSTADSTGLSIKWGI